MLPPRNWSAYDLAPTRGIADTLERTCHLVDAAVRRLKPRTAGQAGWRGRPTTPTANIPQVLILQTCVVVPNRVAEGLLLLFGKKPGVS